MESFFLLPPEIQTHVLCFLSQHELAFLFELECLLEKLPIQELSKISIIDNGFRVLKQQALFAMFHQKPLLLSNDFASKSMPLCHLRTLIDMGINITPSEININVFDFTDYEGSFSLWDCFSPSMFSFLLRLSSKINVEIVLWDNAPLDPRILTAWLEPLIHHSIGLSSFKVRRLSTLGLSLSRPTEASDQFVSVTNTGNIMPETFNVNFLGPFEACRYLSSMRLCINLDNVRHLDLSYNQLSDLDIRSLLLPNGLETLNLSNNSMSVFDSDIFPFHKLLSLRNIDLSNNNIMRLEICQPTEVVCSAVRKLDLSGNFLSSYSQIFSGFIFANLQELDLSHNLISSVSTFSMSMKKVNLAGNYITKKRDAHALSFPKSLEILGIDQHLVEDLHQANEINTSCKL